MALMHDGIHGYEVHTIGRNKGVTRNESDIRHSSSSRKKRSDVQTGYVPHLTTSFRRTRNPQINSPAPFMQPESRSTQPYIHTHQSPTTYDSARRSQSTYLSSTPNGLLQLGIVPDMFYRHQGNAMRDRIKFGLNHSENSSGYEETTPWNNTGPQRSGSLKTVNGNVYQVRNRTPKTSESPSASKRKTYPHSRSHSLKTPRDKRNIYRNRSLDNDVEITEVIFQHEDELHDILDDRHGHTRVSEPVNVVYGSGLRRTHDDYIYGNDSMLVVNDATPVTPQQASPYQRINRKSEHKHISQSVISINRNFANDNVEIRQITFAVENSNEHIQNTPLSVDYQNNGNSWMDVSQPGIVENQVTQDLHLNGVNQPDRSETMILNSNSTITEGRYSAGNAIGVRINKVSDSDITTETLPRVAFTQENEINDQAILLSAESSESDSCSNTENQDAVRDHAKDPAVVSKRQSDILEEHSLSATGITDETSTSSNFHGYNETDNEIKHGGVQNNTQLDQDSDSVDNAKDNNGEIKRELTDDKTKRELIVDRISELTVDHLKLEHTVDKIKCEHTVAKIESDYTNTNNIESMAVPVIVVNDSGSDTTSVITNNLNQIESSVTANNFIQIESSEGQELKASSKSDPSTKTSDFQFMTLTEGTTPTNAQDSKLVREASFTVPTKQLPKTSYPHYDSLRRKSWYTRKRNITKKPKSQCFKLDCKWIVIIILCCVVVFFILFIAIYFTSENR